MKKLDEATRAAFGKWINDINSCYADITESLWEVEDEEIQAALQDYADAIADAESELFEVLKQKRVKLPRLEWI